MKPWIKVAIGCLAVSVILSFMLVAGLLGFGYWAKNKVEEFSGSGPAVEEARKAANAVPFVRPDGGVIAEPRLVRFIEVRADVFSVYEKYRSEIESRLAKMKGGASLDFGDISTGLTFMGELQKAETLALARHGMSEDEYAFINGEVYKAMWTDLGAADAGTQIADQPSLVAKAAAEALKSRGIEGLPPEASEALARAREEIAQASKDASRQIEDAAATAKENVILFKKFENDLKRYAMPGLNLLFGEKNESSALVTPPSQKD